jgi:hypothetical protein
MAHFGDFLPVIVLTTAGGFSPNWPFAARARIDIVGVTSSNLVPPSKTPIRNCQSFLRGIWRPVSCLGAVRAVSIFRTVGVQSEI